MAAHSIKEVRQYLKRNFDGPQVVEALRFRLGVQIAGPKDDPMLNQVWGAYKELPRAMHDPFSVLDCGCMCGFLFHHLSKYCRRFEYTGIDRWAEAITVAREHFPQATFIEDDFTNADLAEHDYVVLSNIPFQTQQELDAAVMRLAPLARRKLFLVMPHRELQIIERKNAA